MTVRFSLPAGILWVAGAVLISVVLLVFRGCNDNPTKAELQADWLLREDTTFKRLRAERDSVIRASEATIKKFKHATRVLTDSVEILLRDVDSQARAAAPTDIPSGISPHDSIVHLSSALQDQIRVAARLREEVVPLLQRIIWKDSLTIFTQDATIENQRLALLDEYRRNDRLTKALSDLRNETKREGKVLGFLPSWTDEALLIVGAGYAGYRLGKGS